MDTYAPIYQYTHTPPQNTTGYNSYTCITSPNTLRYLYSALSPRETHWNSFLEPGAVGRVLHCSWIHYHEHRGRPGLVTGRSVPRAFRARRTRWLGPEGWLHRRSGTAGGGTRGCRPRLASNLCWWNIGYSLCLFNWEIQRLVPVARYLFELFPSWAVGHVSLNKTILKKRIPHILRGQIGIFGWISSFPKQCPSFSPQSNELWNWLIELTVDEWIQILCLMIYWCWDELRRYFIG